jgi:hypothetical protein
MKEVIWNRTTKTFLWGAFFGFIVGTIYGTYSGAGRVYNDCRYAGVTRIGEAAFKCEQFSKVVLLTPDEQYEKAKKGEKK